MVITPAIAVSPNGLCFPPEGCMRTQNRIKNDSWEQCESTCTIGNPVKIRDMNATLYDLVCEGDWGKRSGRIMFRRAEGSGEVIAVDGFSVQTIVGECN